MTLAFASARRSIIFAWTSRDHGQRPILSMLRLSIAITEILSDGVRAEARTPQSYAKRSRASINWVPPVASITSDTPRHRNQSSFQKPALVMASPVCFYCCSTREALRVLAFYANHLSPMKSSKLLNKQCPRGHFYSEKWRQSNFGNYILDKRRGIDHTSAIQEKSHGRRDLRRSPIHERRCCPQTPRKHPLADRPGMPALRRNRAQ